MSWKRFFGVWLLLAVVMTLNGIAREKALVPLLGRQSADIVSAASGVALIFGVSTRALRAVPITNREAARTGLLWAGMAVAFDLVVGHFVDGKRWSTLLGEYAIWRGKLWLVVLTSVVIAPILAVRSLTAAVADAAGRPSGGHRAS